MKPHQTCYNCDGKGAHNEGCPALASPGPVRDADPRAAFDAEAPKHGITVERFKNRPDSYKYENANAMFKLWMAAWDSARAASSRTASDTRTAAGEAECDAALGRAAPASQHDSYSPTIVDCDGLPKAVAAIMGNPRAIVGWANLYALIDGWGQSQREHATTQGARK